MGRRFRRRQDLSREHKPFQSLEGQRAFATRAQRRSGNRENGEPHHISHGQSLRTTESSGLGGNGTIDWWRARRGAAWMRSKPGSSLWPSTSSVSKSMTWVGLAASAAVCLAAGAGVGLADLGATGGRGLDFVAVRLVVRTDSPTDRGGLAECGTGLAAEATGGAESACAHGKAVAMIAAATNPSRMARTPLASPAIGGRGPLHSRLVMVITSCPNQRGTRPFVPAVGFSGLFSPGSVVIRCTV